MDKILLYIVTLYKYMEMWSWRRMIKTNWMEGKSNERILEEIGGER